MYKRGPQGLEEKEDILFEPLAYIVYIRERYYFCLRCKSTKVIRFAEVKARCTKGGPQELEEKLAINVLVSFNLHFHPSYGHSPS